MLSDKVGVCCFTPPHCLPVKSEGVRAITSFAMSTDETFPDLPDFPDIEPVVIHELKCQQEDRFFDYHQYQVPQAWQTAFQTGSLHRKDLPPQIGRASCRERTKHSVVDGNL